jgi:adenosylcobyric acid synthase
MIQGTMSGAGKSILTAGILRVLHQDGYSAAPFKSQNMALNSFVTDDGMEMGRAQALQAAAAGIEPSSDMNPILLKPMGNASSQVILNGRSIGTMKAADYYGIKKTFVPDILAAYERLRRRADIIVIEGAGSPVEINLREGDFVNMGLAEMVDAPVLLTGNIDPGGVFAQLLGTLTLLRPGEKERVRGLVINKFRGDLELLKPGLNMFREYCDIPFAGVVPWMQLDLDEEDSLSERLAGRTSRGLAGSEDIDIAVVRLPYISNYTDFSPLEREQGVRVRYVSDPSSLGDPDLIILPGTKNTMGDLRWLRKTGLERELTEKAHKSSGPLLIGICGGFQMLGKRITDPFGCENGGTAEGLGLLPISTVFGREKYTRQRQGKTRHLPGVFAPLSFLPVSGYEIHMGSTLYPEKDSGSSAEEIPAGFEHLRESVFADLNTGGEERMIQTEGRPDGSVFGPVLGTYLHGIFDETPFRTALMALLRRRKGTMSGESQYKGGIVTPGRESAWQHQERELDALALVLRRSLDWNLIYRSIGI